MFPVSWNKVESACLHLHTNVTFYLPKGWGRFYSLHCDALDKPFLPRLETSLWCIVRKWEETQCILPLVPPICIPSLLCTTDTLYFVYLVWSTWALFAFCWKIRQLAIWKGGVVITSEVLTARLPSMEGIFCFGGGISNTEQIIWVSTTANRGQGVGQKTPEIGVTFRVFEEGIWWHHLHTK